MRLRPLLLIALVASALILAIPVSPALAKGKGPKPNPHQRGTLEEVCGDGICGPGESPATCSEDCGGGPETCCGDHRCHLPETWENCRFDCCHDPNNPAPHPVCGNGICECGESPSGGPTGNFIANPPLICPQDCPSYTCGNNLCEEGEREGQAHYCRTDCGETCRLPPPPPPPSTCGDGICEPSSDCPGSGGRVCACIDCLLRPETACLANWSFGKDTTWARDMVVKGDSVYVVGNVFQGEIPDPISMGTVEGVGEILFPTGYPPNNCRDIWVGKLNKCSGELLWSRTFNVGGYNDGCYDDASAVSVDGEGNVYVAGTSMPTASSYNRDAFIRKFSPEGAPLTFTSGAIQVTWDGISSGAATVVKDMLVDAGYIYLVGASGGDRNAHCESFPASNADIFIMRFTTGGGITSPWIRPVTYGGAAGRCDVATGITTTSDLFGPGGLSLTGHVGTGETSHDSLWAAGYSLSGERSWEWLYPAGFPTGGEGLDVRTVWEGGWWIPRRKIAISDQTTGAKLIDTTPSLLWEESSTPNSCRNKDVTFDSDGDLITFGTRATGGALYSSEFWIRKFRGASGESTPTWETSYSAVWPEGAPGGSGSLIPARGVKVGTDAEGSVYLLGSLGTCGNASDLEACSAALWLQKKTPPATP